jgi:hypothetical protein
VSIVEGDVLDAQTLQGAMRGQDVVFASLAGALEQQARAIVKPRGGAPLAPGSALL